MRSPRAPVVWDVVLYAVAASWAAGTALWASIPLHREWGRLAVIPYLVAAAASAALALRGGGLKARVYIGIITLVGTSLMPMAVEAVWRSRTAPGLHAQSEVIITEEAARALLDGRDPYQATYISGPLAARPLGTKTHYPYLPGMLVFGLPRALDGESALADARVAFTLVSFSVAAASLLLWRTPGGQRLRAAQVMLILPTGALLLTAGGDDVPVLALLLLSLVLMRERRPGWAGVVAGVAAGIKQTAWPVLPFLVLAARGAVGYRSSIRVAVAVAAVAGALVIPFVAWDPSAFAEDVFLFPLGLGEQATAAATPTIGSLLIRALPWSREVVVASFVLVVAMVAGLLLVRRPPRSAADAARQAGLLMGLAVLLAPAARLGYVVYPINLLVWAALLAEPDERLNSPG